MFIVCNHKKAPSVCTGFLRTDDGQLSAGAYAYPANAPALKKLFKKRILFAAGHGNTFDKLSLEDQVYNYHRQHCQQASRHQDREVG